MGLHRESPHLWGPGSAPHLRTCISHLRTCLSHQHKGQFPLTRCRDRAQSCMFHIRMLWEKRSSGRKGFLVTVTQGRSYQRKPHSCTHCRAPARPPRGRTGLGSDPVWLSAGVLPAPPASPETMRGLTCRVAVVPGHGFGDVVPGTGAAGTGRGVRTRRSTAGRPPLPAPTACPLGRPRPNQPLPDARRSPPLAREPRCLIRAHRRHRQAFVEGTNEWMDEWMDGWELLPPSSGLRGPQPCDSRGSGSVRGCFGWTTHADPCGSTRQMGAPFPSQVSRSSAALRCSQERHPRPPTHTHSPRSAAQSAAGHPLGQTQPTRPGCSWHRARLPRTLPDARRGRPRSERRSESERWSRSPVYVAAGGWDPLSSSSPSNSREL